MRWRNGLSELRELATEIVRKLAAAGHVALFVGGCVRDQVMGLEPHDYDIATSAPPQAVKALFEKTIPVGEQFGVVLVVLRGHQFQVATFRSETDYSDGRHPDEVRFADARADVLRRDFTINGLLYDPLADRLIDYVGGREAIREGVIRTIGEPLKRFGEDRLRLLRAVRFAARFNYRIEPQTWRALVALASQVTQVSAERIREELECMLLNPHPDRALELLEQSGLLRAILPEVADLKGLPQPPRFHPEGDAFTHTRLMLRQMCNPSIELAMAVLLHDVGKPPTMHVRERIRFDRHDAVGAQIARAVCQRLRFSNVQTRRIMEMVQEHMRFLSVRQMRPVRLKAFLSMENIEEHLELHRLDCVASHGDLSTYEFCREKLKELTAEDLKPRPLLGGCDLIELGLKPGPVFTRILNAVREKQLDGELHSREEALEFVRESFPEARSLTQ